MESIKQQRIPISQQTLTLKQWKRRKRKSVMREIKELTKSSN